MQSCGGCRYFIKVKSPNFGNSGLCDKHDCRTDEDCGCLCKDFKPPKYKRIRKDWLNDGTYPRRR